MSEISTIEEEDIHDPVLVLEQRLEQMQADLDELKRYQVTNDEFKHMTDTLRATTKSASDLELEFAITSNSIRTEMTKALREVSQAQKSSAEIVIEMSGKYYGYLWRFTLFSALLGFALGALVYNLITGYN